MILHSLIIQRKDNSPLRPIQKMLAIVAEGVVAASQEVWLPGA